MEMERWLVAEGLRLWVCEGEDGCRRWKMTERGEVAAVLVEGDEGNWRWGREKSCVVLEEIGRAHV